MLHKKKNPRSEGWNDDWLRTGAPQAVRKQRLDRSPAILRACLRTLLYLGGNESSTHKYISEALGKSTIDTKTHGQTKGRSGSYSTNFQMSGRELLTPDEVRMLDNRYCILFIRGARPVLDLKYELMEHPAIRYTMDGGAPPYIHHGTATPTLPGEPLFRFDQNDEKEIAA